MQIFGNDGFRSKYGEKYMTLDFMTAFTKAVSYIYNTKFNNEPILIARDTRFTGIVIQNIIT